MQNEPVTVTQADRERAADYEECFPPHMGGEVFRDGVADDHALVQAFAAHRAAAMEEAAMMAEQEDGLMLDFADGKVTPRIGKGHSVAKAIRALAKVVSL